VQNERCPPRSKFGLWTNFIGAGTRAATIFVPDETQACKYRRKSGLTSVCYPSDLKREPKYVLSAKAGSSRKRRD
jgi:hypothetical protein